MDKSSPFKSNERIYFTQAEKNILLDLKLTNFEAKRKQLKAKSYLKKLHRRGKNSFAIKARRNFELTEEFLGNESLSDTNEIFAEDEETDFPFEPNFDFSKNISHDNKDANLIALKNEEVLTKNKTLDFIQNKMAWFTSIRLGIIRLAKLGQLLHLGALSPYFSFLSLSYGYEFIVDSIFACKEIFLAKRSIYKNENNKFHSAQTILNNLWHRTKLVFTPNFTKNFANATVWFALSVAMITLTFTSGGTALPIVAGLMVAGYAFDVIPHIATTIYDWHQRRKMQKKITHELNYLKQIRSAKLDKPLMQSTFDLHATLHELQHEQRIRHARINTNNINHYIEIDVKDLDKEINQIKLELRIRKYEDIQRALKKERIKNMAKNIYNVAISMALLAGVVATSLAVIGVASGLIASSFFAPPVLIGLALGGAITLLVCGSTLSGIGKRIKNKTIHAFKFIIQEIKFWHTVRKKNQNHFSKNVHNKPHSSLKTDTAKMIKAFTKNTKQVNNTNLKIPNEETGLLSNKDVANKKVSSASTVSTVSTHENESAAQSKRFTLH